jgi:hypothetical protein
MNNGIVALGPLMWESTATSATKLQKKIKHAGLHNIMMRQTEITLHIVYPMPSCH